METETQSLIDQLRDCMVGMDDRTIADKILPALFDGRYEVNQRWSGDGFNTLWKITMYPENE